MERHEFMDLLSRRNKSRNFNTDLCFLNLLAPQKCEAQMMTWEEANIRVITNYSNRRKGMKTTWVLICTGKCRSISPPWIACTTYIVHWGNVISVDLGSASSLLHKKQSCQEWRCSYGECSSDPGGCWWGNVWVTVCFLIDFWVSTKPRNLTTPKALICPNP